MSSRDILRTSWGRHESASQGRALKVRLERSLDVISGRPQDGQIRSLGDVLGTLEGDVLEFSWGPIFAGCDVAVESVGSSFSFLNH